MFDEDTRLYIATVELVRTGRYFRRLKSDIRGRNVVLDGIAARYRDDRDEYGWFDVLSAPWPWPRRESGREVSRFGVSDETCRKVAARLLMELREPKAATGGAAPTSRRPGVPCSGSTTGSSSRQALRTVRRRGDPVGRRGPMQQLGKANFILLFRRASAGAGTRTVAAGAT